MIVRLTTVSLGALTLALPAQDQPDHQAALRAACDKMSKLAGVEFSTFESQDAAMMRRFRAQMPGGAGEVEIDGWSCAGVIQASLNFGDDEIIGHGGRMVAKTDDGWKPRHNALAYGGRLPFVFDPDRFFQLVARLPNQQCKVVHTETTTYRNQEMTIYSATLDGQTGGEFTLSGAVPGLSAGGMIMRMGGGAFGGGGGAASIPDTTIDLAFYVTPEDNLIHRVKVKAYQKSSMPGNVQFQIAGGGGFGGGQEEQEKEDVEEFDADGKRIYKKGMPVRELAEDTSAMEFDVRFKSHGKTFAPELDAKARDYLRLK